MSTSSRAARPRRRDGYWYLVRKVPKDLRDRYPTAQVTLTTGIRAADDPKAIRARERFAHLNELVEQQFARIRAGETHAATKLDLAALKRARELDIKVLPVTDLAKLNLHDLWQRFAAVTQAVPLAERLADQPALLRDIAVAFAPPEPPKPGCDIRVSQLLAEYERLNAPALARKSSSQMRLWRVRRQTALTTFLAAIDADPVITELTRDHIGRFINHWNSRILAGDIQINSANRQIRQMTGLYGSVRRHLLLTGDNPFRGARIPGGRDGKRIAYAPTFVQEHFLKTGMFDGINPEARRLIYLIIETGLRLSEACALTAGAIHLDEPIPYVEVLDDAQDTKTPGSVRQVPLVGVALMAMQAQPDGFPNYRHKGDRASAVINAALMVRKLRPRGRNQTLYSMRHTLVDRLKAVEAPNDIQEDILGHVHQYGHGTTLEHRHRWLARIAFIPPAYV